jgi:hypothetical protein
MSKPSRGRKWLKRLGQIGLVGALLMGGLWVAVHRVQWLGPAIADGLRSVLGPGPVAWMEDAAYGVQDWVNRWRYADDAPKTFWEVPEGLPTGDHPPQAPEKATPSWQPPGFEAPFDEVATPVDGKWIPVDDPRRPQADPVLFKSMVHPDRRRSFAALAVVAIDTEALDLHLLAGTKEPTSYRVPRDERPGMIPKEHQDDLVAAFNGGFKTTHGHYGMMLDGVEFVPPREIACTFARYRDGRYRIRTWTQLEGDVDEMRYYRQTPPCLVEEGELHDRLRYQEYAKGWGATVSGDTIIRRSAIGLSEDGKTLFYGIGEAMTAQSLARGMKAAGAHDAAELDVNYSYPRFLFYEQREGDKMPKAASCLIPNVEYSKWHYVGQASPRDFFYLVYDGKQARGPAAATGGKLAVTE